MCDFLYCYSSELVDLFPLYRNDHVSTDFNFRNSLPNLHFSVLYISFFPAETTPYTGGADQWDFPAPAPEGR